MTNAYAREDLVEQVRSEKNQDPVRNRKRADKYLNKALAALDKTFGEVFTESRGEDGGVAFTRTTNSIKAINNTEESVAAYRRLTSKFPEYARHESGILDVLYVLQERSAVQNRKDPILVSKNRYDLFLFDLNELREAAEVVAPEDDTVESVVVVEPAVEVEIISSTPSKGGTGKTPVVADPDTETNK